MGPIQSLSDLISLIRRRFWLMVVVVLLGCVGAVLLALSRPHEYMATAVIQIEQPIVAGAATTGAATPAGDAGMAVQLQAIQQRLTTREALLDLIARHNLFSDLPALPDEQRIGLLRENITFQTIASVANTTPGAPTRISAISVSARLGTAEQAARVANDMAQAILDRGSQEQALRAADTLKFYTEEETRLWNEIVALEAEIAAFKNRNPAALPAQQAALQDELTGVETDLRALNQTRLGLVAQRDALAAQTDLRTTGQRQLESLNAQIAALDQQKQGLEARQAEVRAATAASPEVEQALNAYNRRLTQLQDQHEVVSQQLAAAQTAQRLADRQQAERFSLLERAVTPDYPVGSSRKKLALMGGILSLALAFGVALLLDLRRPVVRSSAQMERQTGLIPVVVLPDLDRGRPRRG